MYFLSVGFLFLAKVAANNDSDSNAYKLSLTIKCNDIKEGLKINTESSTVSLVILNKRSLLVKDVSSIQLHSLTNATFCGFCNIKCILKIPKKISKLINYHIALHNYVCLDFALSIAENEDVVLSTKLISSIDSKKISFDNFNFHTWHDKYYTFHRFCRILFSVSPIDYEWYINELSAQMNNENFCNLNQKLRNLLYNLFIEFNTDYMANGKTYTLNDKDLVECISSELEDFTNFLPKTIYFYGDDSSRYELRMNDEVGIHKNSKKNLLLTEACYNLYNILQTLTNKYSHLNVSLISIETANKVQEEVNEFLLQQDY